MSNSMTVLNVLQQMNLLWFFTACVGVVTRNGTDGQLAVGWASSDDRSVQAAEAGVHHSAAYLLATQRHSTTTASSSPAAQLSTISPSPWHSSLLQVLWRTNDDILTTLCVLTTASRTRNTSLTTNTLLWCLSKNVTRSFVKLATRVCIMLLLCFLEQPYSRMNAVAKISYICLTLQLRINHRLRGSATLL